MALMRQGKMEKAVTEELIDELVDVIASAISDQRLEYNEHVPLSAFIADAIICMGYRKAGEEGTLA
jgi:hypothetical protein